MPKLKKVVTGAPSDLTHELYMALRVLYRNNLIEDGPEEITSPRHRHLTTLLHSLTANQPVTLLQADLVAYPELEAAAYHYDPLTQTFTETQQIKENN